MGESYAPGGVAMSDRTMPFEPDSRCECCGAMGAFDFMGDLLCARCAFPKDMDDSGEEKEIRDL